MVATSTAKLSLKEQVRNGELHASNRDLIQSHVQFADRDAEQLSRTGLPDDVLRQSTIAQAE